MAQDKKIIDIVAQLKDEFSGVANKITDSLSIMDKTLKGLAKVQLSPKLADTLKQLDANGQGAAQAIQKLNKEIKGGALPTSLGKLQEAAHSVSKELKDLSHRSLETSTITKKTKTIVNNLNQITTAAKTAGDAIKRMPAVSEAVTPKTKAVEKTSPVEQTIQKEIKAKEELVDTNAKLQASTEKLKGPLDRQKAAYEKIITGSKAIEETSNHLIKTTEGRKEAERNLGIEIQNRDLLQKRSLTLVSEAITLQNQLKAVERGATEEVKKQSQELRASIDQTISALDKQRNAQQKLANELKTKQGKQETEAISVKSVETAKSKLKDLKSDLLAINVQVTSINGSFKNAEGSATRLTSVSSGYSKELTRILKLQQDLSTEIGRASQLKGEGAAVVAAELQALSKKVELEKTALELSIENTTAKKLQAVATEEHTAATAKVRTEVQETVKSQKELVSISEQLNTSDASRIKNQAEISRRYKKQEASIKQISVLQEEVSRLMRFQEGDPKALANLKAFETALKKIQVVANETKAALAEGLKVDKSLHKATKDAENLTSSINKIQTEYEELRSSITSSTGKIQIFKDEDLLSSKAKIADLKIEVRTLLKTLTQLSSSKGGKTALKSIGIDSKNATTEVSKLQHSIQTLGASLSQYTRDRSVEFGEVLAGVRESGVEVADSLRTMTEKGATAGKAVGNALESMGKRFGQNTTEAKKFAGAIDHLEEEMVRFRSGVVTWSTGLLMLGAAVTAPFYQAIKIFTELSDTLAQVRAVTNANAMEFENLEAVATKMGRTTRFTAKQAADGLLYLGRAGFTATEAVAALPTTLRMAQAAAIDLGRAADIATNIMTSFSLEVNKLPHAADVLTKAFTSSNATLENLGVGFTYVGSIAKGLGTEFEDVIGALAKLHDAGFKGTMAGTALRGALDGLFNPTKAEAELLDKLSERLGFLDLQIRNASGGFVGFSALIGQLEDAGFTAEEALKLFGQRAGPGMAALLRIGSKNLADYKESLKDAGGATQAIAEIMDETLKGAFLRLKSAAEGLGESFGSGIEGGLKVLLDTLSSAINIITDFKESLGPVGDLLGAMVGILGAVIGAVGTLTFAWFLMIVPLKQFAVAFGTLIKLFKAGTEKLLGFEVAEKASLTTLIKKAFQLSVNATKEKQAAQATDIHTAALKRNTAATQANNMAASLRTATVVPSQLHANVLLPPGYAAKKAGAKVGAAALEGMTDAAKKGAGPFKSIFTDIFVNLGTVAGIWATSFAGTLSTVFTIMLPQLFELIRGVGSFTDAVQLAKKALINLGKFLWAHPLLLTITAATTLFFIFRDTVTAANKEVEHLITKTQSFGGKAKQSISKVIQAYNSLENLDTEQLFTEVGTQALDDLQGSLVDTAAQLKKTIKELGEFGDIPELQMEIVPKVKDEGKFDFTLEVEGREDVLLATDDIERMRENAGKAKDIMQELSDVVAEQTKKKEASLRVDMAVRSLNATQDIRERIIELQNEGKAIKANAADRLAAVKGYGGVFPVNEAAYANKLEQDNTEEILRQITLYRKRGKVLAQQLDLANISYEEAITQLRRVAQERYDAAQSNFWPTETRSVESYRKEVEELAKAHLRLKGVSENVAIEKGFKRALGSLSQVSDHFEEINEALDEMKEKADDAIDSLTEIEDSKFELEIEGIDDKLVRDIEAIGIAFSKLENSQETSDYFEENMHDRQRLYEGFYTNKTAIEERALLLERNQLEASLALTKTSLEEKRAANERYAAKLKQIAVNSQRSTLEAIRSQSSPTTPLEEGLIKTSKILDSGEIVNVYKRVTGEIVKISKRAAGTIADVYENSDDLIGEAKRKTLEATKQILEEEYEVTKTHLEDLLDLRAKYIKRIQDTEKQRLAFSKKINDAIKDFTTKEDKDESFAKRKRKAELEHQKDKQRLLRITSEIATAAAAGDLKALNRLSDEAIEIVKRAKEMAEKQSGDPSALIKIDPMEAQLYERSLKRYESFFNEATGNIEQDAEDHISALNTTIGDLQESLGGIASEFVKVGDALRQTFDDEGGMQKLTDGMGKLTKATEDLITQYQKIIEHQQQMIDKQKKVNELKKELGNIEGVSGTVGKVGELSDKLTEISKLKVDFSDEKSKAKVIELATEIDNLSIGFGKAIEGLRALGQDAIADKLEDTLDAFGTNWGQRLTDNGKKAKDFEKIWSLMLTTFNEGKGTIEEVGEELTKTDESLKEGFLDKIESQGLFDFLDTVKQKFQDLGDLDIDIQTAGAVKSLGKVETAFKNIQKAAAALQKKFSMKVTITGGPAYAKGGLVDVLPIPKLASGGKIKGPGTGTSDSIMAWLSNGEYVMDAKTTSFFGPKFFKALQGIGNSTINPLRSVTNIMPNLTPQFASGGPVTNLVRTATGTGEVITVNLNAGGEEFSLYGERKQAQGLVNALKNMDKGL